MIHAAPPRDADEVRLTHTASAPTFPPETMSPSAAGWRELPVPPLSPREGAAAFWAAGRVIVVGGSSSTPCPPGAGCLPPPEPPLRDGAAYEPATERWQPIAPAPVAVFYSSGAVVDDVVYLRTTPRGYEGAESPAPSAFLAYHPDEDRWEELPSPPSEAPEYLSLAAAGDELIAHESSQEQEVTGDWSYTPATGRWVPLPPDPLAPAFGRSMVWTGDELVLLGVPATTDPAAGEPAHYRAAALDRETAAWRALPDSEVASADSRWFWTGSAVVNPSGGRVDGGPTNGLGRTYAHGGALDPSTGRWSPLPPGPELVYPDLYVTAGGQDTLFDSDGAALHVPTGTWELLGVRDDLPTGSAATAWTGESLVVVGGALHDEDESRLVGDAFAWTPSWHAATTTP